jgi:type IV fimbrial biogenesis protein FimT
MKKESGFTLIELMITLIVAAILLTVGVPSLKSFIQNGKVTEARDSLRSALFVARSAAISEKATGCVCPTADAAAVVPACKNDGNWETGWIAFAEITDASGACVYDGGTDILLKVYDGSNNDSTTFAIRNDNPSINTPNYVRFNSRGAPVQQNGVAQQGTFSICDDRGVVVDATGKTRARAIILSVAGSTRDTNIAAQITGCPL